MARRPWLREPHGIGSALLEAAELAARTAGCDRLWLVTTNDNVDALRFYQRRGFRLSELHPGAVDASRATLKPSISDVGDHGIPLRDELVPEKRCAIARSANSSADGLIVGSRSTGWTIGPLGMLGQSGRPAPTVRWPIERTT